jgi:hypothetical protein
MTDLLDPQLDAAFAAAHDDPRWAVPAWPDPVRRVRTGARRARRRAALAGAAASVALAGVAAAVVRTLPAGEQRVVPASPLAGGTGSGLDWLLTPTQYSDYAAAHPSPSAGPPSVSSPAPATAELRQLEADVAAALPAGYRVLRTDAADGGAAGSAVVWARLADGTPVAIERRPLAYPVDLGASSDPTEAVKFNESYTDPQSWPDDTAYSVATGTTFGYGFGGDTQWHGPFVLTATKDGWFTSWTAPVPVNQLLAWARAGDASFTAR